MALELLKDTEAKRASTQSRPRRRPTFSVDDSNVDRYGKTIAYCSNWWSNKHSNTIWGQNILGITIKIGDVVIPLNIRLVSKQERGNTKKPVLFVAMMEEVLDFFDAQGANAGLGIKVMSHLLLLRVSILERRTFHQIQLELTGKRQMLLEIMTHFHELNLKEP